MDIGALLGGLVNNPLVTAILGAVGGGLILLLYNFFKVTAMIKQGGYKAGKWIGYFIYSYGLVRITDKALRDKVTADLDESGGEFDRGWDEGIRGNKP